MGWLPPPFSFRCKNKEKKFKRKNIFKNRNNGGMAYADMPLPISLHKNTKIRKKNALKTRIRM